MEDQRSEHPEIDDVPAHGTLLPLPMRKTYGRGYVRDEDVGHDKSGDLSVRHLLGAAAAALPTEASLEEFIQKVRNQQKTSLCTGFAFALATHIRLLKIAKDAGHPTTIPFPSPVGICTAGRAGGRDTTHTHLTDDGAAPSEVVKGMLTQGIPWDAEWPPGGFDKAYADPADPDHEFVDHEPTLKELEAAGAFVLQGVYRIGEGSTQTVHDVCHALSAGYPVAVGVNVDQAFEDQDGSKVCPPCGPDVLGGHMLCVVAYRTNRQGAREFLVCNSWGEGWALRGLFWASEAWLKSASDLYAITVHTK